MSLPAVGLPTIARAFGIDAGHSIVLVLAYQTALAAVLLPLAAVGDWIGHRRLCAIGLGVVALGSTVCALGSTFGVLIIARVLQGLGAAAILAVCSAMIRDAYPPALLGRGIANNAMIVSVSSAITPPVAGALIALGSWRLLFVVPAVFAVAALLLGVRTLPRSVPTARPPELVSAALVALTFGPLVLGINLLSQRAGPLLAIMALAIAAGAGTILFYQQRHLEAPLLPLDLLRVPELRLSIATAFASFAAQTVALIALPFTLQNALHMSPATAGGLLSCWPAAVLITTAVSGTLADRIAPGFLGTIGLAVTGLGFGLFWLAGPGVGPYFVAGTLTLVGVGIGLFQVPNNRLIVSSAPLHRRGMVGGLVATNRITGQSIGAALAAYLLLDPSQPLRPLVLASALALGAATLSALRLRQH